MVAVRILITLPDEAEVIASARTAKMSAQDRQASIAQHMRGLPASLKVDHKYRPVPIHRDSARELNQTLPRARLVGSHAYVVRGTIDNSELDTAAQAVDDVQRPRIFSDPNIRVMVTCANDAPVGSAFDVGRLLGLGRLAGFGMNGNGVAVAIVDTGINLPFLQARGLRPKLDVHASWSPSATMVPGAAPIDHGSMCAFDALIAAPDATLMDFAVLTPIAFSGILSDAIIAYGKLLQLMTLPAEERAYHSLIVSNSWGIFDPSWDLPPGNPGRYIDNPNHPFHSAVSHLAQSGADILFAAGNCGPTCPDARCAFPANTATITGANSYSEVITVGGVDTTQAIVGYSSYGPGAISPNKPDLCAYTHFAGSEAFGPGTPDSGTSAACPVLAGVVAALRSKFPFDPQNPNRSAPAIKRFLLANATHRPAGGFDYQLGTGIVDTSGFANATAIQ